MKLSTEEFLAGRRGFKGRHSEIMDIEKVKEYWVQEADEALQVAWHLFEKKDYSYALFFGHLAVEKIFKAIYVVKKGEQSPYIHNLQSPHSVGVGNKPKCGRIGFTQLPIVYQQLALSIGEALLYL